jgi:methylated-DNA-protein-cysteine methyltransferase related protein
MRRFDQATKSGEILLSPPKQSSSISLTNYAAQDSVYARVYAVVCQIPRGKVSTYGQIAKIVDRCTARMVGYAMAALRGRTDVPWQRVINSKGEISTRSRGDGAIRQRKLLEKEGIRFDPRGRVNLRKVRWAESKAGSCRKPPMEKDLRGKEDFP